MFEYRAYVGLDVHKETIATAVAWPGREEPEYRGILPNHRNSSTTFRGRSNSLIVKALWSITASDP